MLKAQEQAASHVDLFIERYERLFLWSLQLTENDQQQAEDLLHDAFIQFTLGQADLNSIQNLEGYLRTMLRNIHVSQVRRSARSPIRSLSIVEYDSAELGLRVIDPRTQMNVQDELRTICQYACARKESAKAGSILILRFFHGYYPDEISNVSRISRPAVKDRLRLARAEAKLYLDSPKALSFMQQNQETKPNAAQGQSKSDDFLSELRQTIFNSRCGDCLTKKEHHALYNSEESDALDCARLAHITSCPQCLDEVNALLNLPPLSSRYPAETAGKDQPRRKGGPGGMGPRGGTGMSSVSGYLRRTKEVFEHEPQELFISVNGYILGSQKISSELMEQTLSLKGEENIGFVEVFSEQEIRLLLLNVEPLPDGSVKQSALVRLGQGRTVELSLSFSGAWPTLHVVYRDPSLAQESNEIFDETSAISALSTDERKPKRTTTGESIKRIAARLRRGFADWSLWLRPSIITAVFAVILIAVLLLVYLRSPVAPVSATELLRRATVAEETNLAKTDQVLHRTISLEERASAGQLIARHKIEVWRSAEEGITARRLYDERGQLIAGDWRRADGVQTLYSHGSRPRIQSVPEKRAATPLSFDDVWQLEPSAKEFAQLIANPDGARVQEFTSTRLISYAGNSSDGLINATLLLSRADLHAVEQTLTLQRGNELREFRFVEDSFERRAPDAVQQTVFDPEPELLTTEAGTRRSGDTGNNSASPALPVAPSPVPATPELEVEVLGLLHQAGADLGEQVTVTRTSEGQLLIEALVETADRKDQLLDALESVRTNPAVQIKVSTIAEAMRRQSVSKSSPESIVIEREEGSSRSGVADSELRRYFSAKGLSPEQVDQEVTRFANRAVNQSLQVMVHAGAIRRVAERFSAEQLKALTLEARAQWLTIVRSHAQSVRQETVGLRQQLQPVFPSAVESSREEQIDISNDADLLRAIERLFEICAANDRIVSSAFTIKSSDSNMSDLQGPQFWRSLRRAEQLAAKIAGRQ
jgi:RNA polymerase sigma factor (sigma-70 family)